MKPSSTRSRVVWPFLLGVLIATAYLGNGRTLGSGDTLPASQLPVSILNDGTFYLDEFLSSYTRFSEHSLRHIDGHWVSAYPVGAPILALPFYIPSAVVGLGPHSPSLEPLEKISATGIAILSAAVVFFTLRRLTSPGVSLAVTAVYALGTSTFSTSSQALWQHGPGQLAVASALYCLVRGAASPGWLALSGFPMAFAVLCRPADVLLVVPLAAFVLVRHTHRFPALLLCGLPVGGFMLWYNLTYLGTPFYSQFGDRVQLWDTPLSEGLAGLLISPGRGLFFYSPILLFSVAGFVKAWKARGDDAAGLALLRYASVGVVLVVLVHGKWWSWWGGVCFGPRLLADTLPVLCLALYPVADRVLAHRGWRVFAAVLATWSFAAHFIGVYWDDGRWNAYVTPEGLWSWTDNPLMNPPRELFNRLVINLRDLPTSGTHPDLLACSYLADESSPSAGGRARAKISVTMTALNTGTAVWIAWPKRASSSVRLEWELTPTDANVAEESGSVALRHDVFPGDAYEFRIPLALPRRPGEYRLRAGLVSNRGNRLSSLGAEPWVIPVQVTPRRGGGAGLESGGLNE